MTAIASFIQRFKEISGLTTYHAAVTSDSRLEFDGYNPDGTKFHIQSLPAPGRLDDETRSLATLQKNQILERLAKEITPKMSILGNDSATSIKGIADLKAALTQSRSKLEQVKKDGADTAARMGKVAADLETEIEAINTELGQFTNE